jgi:4-amino-4-deoxy-L-arabinose transferase-like glycosyltransferase
LGVVTTGFLWFLARKWFNSLVALIVAFLYSISPTLIIHSRSSWNPNIMPFFALLSIYSIWRVWAHKEYKWLVALGVSYAFVLQSHYLGLILAPVLGLFWVVALSEVWKNNAKRKLLINKTTVGFFILSLLMSPLLIFDARHGWRNFSAMSRFFTEKTSMSTHPISVLSSIWPVWENIVTRLLAGRNEFWGFWLSILMIVGLIYYFVRIISKKDKTKRMVFFLITTWVLIGVLGLSLYRHDIFDHYFGFLFPAPYLLLAVVFHESSRVWYGKNLILLITIFLIVLNIKDTPLKYPPNKQMQRAKDVSSLIINNSTGEKFNLAVLAERNYEDGYQYFLEKEEAKVVDIDPVNTKETITKQLFVVCELPEEECKPTTSPKAEIANFGWSRVKREWKISGVTVYKLVHAK